LNPKPSTPIRKKSANLSVGADLLAEARALNINISQAAEAGILQAIAEENARLWRRENQEAIHSSNLYVKEHGLPLSGLRQF
jgi:antitoxin CcdA